MARSKILLAALVSASLLAGSVVAYSSAGGARAKVLPRATPTFVISGRGWGHGVGMAQWGAYGYAQQGGPTTRSLPTTTRAPLLALPRWRGSASCSPKDAGS